jgi:cytochrome c oxidase subunit 5b
LSQLFQRTEKPKSIRMQRILQPALRLSRQSPVAIRSIATTAPRWSGGSKPAIFGEGAKAGEVASDEQQATGLERLQLLGRMKGVDVFNEQPLDASRLGTLDDPIVVPSLVSSKWNAKMRY